MSETQGLVSWESLQDLGTIEGSDWVCPTGNLGALESVHMLNGERTPVTDEEVLVMADGRRQHLSLGVFPEGYHAARIVDSETGKVLTDNQAGYRYAGIFKCGCGAVHGAAQTSVLSGDFNTIQIEDGIALTGIYNYSDGTLSIINPTLNSADSDYFQRTRTGLQITPASRNLYLHAEVAMGAVEGGGAKIDIRETNGIAKMVLDVWAADYFDITGQVSLEIAGNGLPTKMRVYKKGLLNALGLQPEQSDFAFNESGWGGATTQKAESDVLEAMNEVLGSGPWTGFDLKMTASGLYKAMGSHNLDLASVLVSKGA